MSTVARGRRSSTSKPPRKIAHDEKDGRPTGNVSEKRRLADDHKPSAHVADKKRPTEEAKRGQIGG
eukprot:CAMPEP_0174330072 /NCGR_PEP_ID=MMETSP0810-20121108/16377_1 /TAXON_ID=73025 ORGANISM="Eutreptiella gymnastica-like, Strain CCMP1594" /NCGR_SAMPLE_ID=MMETSP0810 /ASSEMBLY_ACC=CAM_ASM_000659 /LENGTH=65 /DNA_ID=CAMNT_0015445005 /DNA_START=60 /DNA_END=253 /DNA_ORIENTATION=+